MRKLPEHFCSPFDIINCAYQEIVDLKSGKIQIPVLLMRIIYLTMNNEYIFINIWDVYRRNTLSINERKLHKI